MDLNAIITFSSLFFSIFLVGLVIFSFLVFKLKKRKGVKKNINQIRYKNNLDNIRRTNSSLSIPQKAYTFSNSFSASKQAENERFISPPTFKKTSEKFQVINNHSVNLNYISNKQMPNYYS